MSRIQEQNEKGDWGGVMDRKQQLWQKGKGRLDGRVGGKMAKGQERRRKFNIK